MTEPDERQERLREGAPADYSDLKALFINCTLKRSPEVSNTQGLADLSIAIMERNGVTVDQFRAVDHEIATGVWPDMSEHGWERDDWPALFERVLAAEILVILTPIWLGEKSSVCTQVIERLYGNSHLLNDAGQYAYYGRVGGCLVTGNEDGGKHCAMNILYSLQHLGYGTCCTSRACSRTPAGSRRTATSAPSGTPAAASTSRIRSTASSDRLHAPAGTTSEL
jgi:multimeric flavodoxin WrbA